MSASILKVTGAIFTLIGIVLCITVIGIAAGIPTIISGIVIFSIGDITSRTERIEKAINYLVESDNIRKLEILEQKEKDELEEANRKTCPKCDERIEAMLKVCKYCGFEYFIIQTITVFSPEDGKQKHFLIKKIIDKTGKNYSDINDELSNGMLFKFKNDKILKESKHYFEHFGCKVEEGEIISPDMQIK
jgi:uncharacterized protein (UPF0212 family)